MAYQDDFKRKEVKYRLTAAQAARMRTLLASRMQADAYGSTLITSMYYDTRERSMIARSLEKPLYKEKLRLRRYGRRDDAAPVFVELKKKYKGIVYKRRVAVSAGAASLFMAGAPYERAIARWPLPDAALQATAASAKSCQIAAEIAACVQRTGPVMPSISIACERVAWAPLPDAADAAGVRVTFDSRIRYRDLFQPQPQRVSVPIIGAGEELMEVKVPGAYPLWLAEAIDAIGAKPTSYSKYGQAYLDCTGGEAARLAFSQPAVAAQPAMAV